MNPKIDSFIRHIFTAWITAAVLGLTTWFALDEKSAATLAEGFGKIADGLLVILAVLVPALGRLLWAWLAKIFQDGTGELENRDGPSGGAALLAFGTAAALMGGLLPSCSAPLPVQIGIAGPGFAGSYSAKGLNIQAVIPTK